MEIDEILAYCNAKKGVEETFPFDQETSVFKVGGKMFLVRGPSCAAHSDYRCLPHEQNPLELGGVRRSEKGINPKADRSVV